MGGWPKNFTNVADRITIFFGGSQEKKKKFGGVTGIGLHAVSMPSLDSGLLWGVPREKNRRSHRKWTSRRFSHHSSAKDKLKTIFLSLTLFPILNSQAEKKNVQIIDISPPIKHIEHTKQISQAKRPTTDNSPPIKHIEHTKQISQAKRPTTHNSPPIKHVEHTKQISQAKRPTTDNSPPIKHIEHTKQISQAKRPTTDNSPPIKRIEHTKQLPSLVAQVHQRQIENATQG
ncbi:hypothetical protein TNCV_1463951 [Trichonephila clavipes]|nr:hypothetical protein TNCV_1463951 [Trichonephila clavipes]